MHESVSTALPAMPSESKATPWYFRASDMMLAAMALALAFLLASYAVRNADFWQHLAAGRLLAAGQYSFGVDPFGYGQPDKYWTNHAWGFDAVIYQIHQRLGGSVFDKGQGPRSQKPLERCLEFHCAVPCVEDDPIDRRDCPLERQHCDARADVAANLPDLMLNRAERGQLYFATPRLDILASRALRRLLQ